MPWHIPTYREDANGRQISGTVLLAVIHNEVPDHPWGFYITAIRVYQDGIIDCWDLVDLDTFKRKARSGWLVTRFPDGAKVDLSGPSVGIRFTAVDIAADADVEDLIRQVEDEIRWLNGQPTTADTCREAFEAYQRAPSAAAILRLHATYTDVPTHLRPELLADDGDGGLEEIDYKIRYILKSLDTADTQG